MSKTGGKRAKKTSSKKEPLSLPPLTDEMLHSILNNTHEGIVILGDEFKFEFVNDVAAQIFGGTQEDLLDQDFRQFMPPEMVKVVGEYYVARRKGEDVPSHYPLDILRKDGAIRTFEARVSVIKGPDGKLKTIAHLIDITEILADTEAREESETRYELLVETMNDGLVIDDPVGNLVYTANGDKTLSKERFEIFGGNMVFIIDDFKKGFLFRNNKEQQFKTSGKGHQEEIKAFFKALSEGREIPITFRSICLTTLTTFKITESIVTGLPQAIEL